MTDKEQLSAIIQRMETLLIASKQDEWAHLLERTLSLSKVDCSAAKGEILHYFGGAGSISDLDLNAEFTELRTELYSLCYGSRHTTH